MNRLIKPSSLLPKGMRIQQINHLTLFKFTDELGDRLQTLLDKKKADALTATENFEIEAIAELDEIFSYLPQLSLGYCHKIFIKLTVNVVSIFTHSCLDVDRFCVKLLRLCKKATLNTKNLKFYGKKESSKLDIG